MYCNVCGETQFKNFSNRVDVQCVSCNSLERHRILRRALLEHDFTKEIDSESILYICGDEDNPIRIDEFLNSRRDFNTQTSIYKFPFVVTSKIFEVIIFSNLINKLSVEWFIFLKWISTVLKTGGIVLFTANFSDSKNSDVNKNDLKVNILNLINLPFNVDYGPEVVINIIDFKFVCDLLSLSFEKLAMDNSSKLDIRAAGCDVYLIRKY